MFTLGTFIGTIMSQFLKKTMDNKWVKLSYSGYFKNFEQNPSSYRVFVDFQKIIKLLKIEQIKSQVIARLKIGIFLAPKYNVPIWKKTKKKPWTIYKWVKLSKNQAI